MYDSAARAALVTVLVPGSEATMSASRSGQGTSEDDSFQDLLVKLAGIDPLNTREQRKAERSISINEPKARTRQPMPVPEVIPEYDPVIECDPPGMFASGAEGLERKGWLLFPGKPLGAGNFGRVTLGMKLEDQGKQPDQRRICAIKVSEIPTEQFKLNAWHEVNSMRCLVHEHIIEYYDHFMVKPQSGPDVERSRKYEREHRLLKRRHSPKEDDSDDEADRPAPVNVLTEPYDTTVWICMEFVNGGTLWTEMKRYKDRIMPEPGIVYYCKQVNSALTFMHSRNFAHNDLHSKNVLVMILPNRTKKAMLSDLGHSRYPSDIHMHAFDLERMYQLVSQLIECGIRDPTADKVRAKGRSDLAMSFFNMLQPYGTVPFAYASQSFPGLLQHPFMQMPAVAPIPATNLPQRPPSASSYKSLEEYRTANPPERRSRLQKSVSPPIPEDAEVLHVPLDLATIGQSQQTGSSGRSSRSSRSPNIVYPLERQRLRPPIHDPEYATKPKSVRFHTPPTAPAATPPATPPPSPLPSPLRSPSPLPRVTPVLHLIGATPAVEPGPLRRTLREGWPARLEVEEPIQPVTPSMGRRVRRGLSRLGRGVVRRIRSVPLPHCFGRRDRRDDSSDGR